MLGHFAQVPATAVAQPTPFTICIFGTKIEEMRQLIKLARLGSPTYESVQDDRKYGITHSWLEDAREEWLKYDWYVCCTQPVLLSYLLDPQQASDSHPGTKPRTKSTPFQISPSL